MIKVELLFSVIVLAVWVFTLVDVAQAPEAAVRTLPKLAWLVIVLLFPVLGSVGWFVLGRPEGRAGRPARAHERHQPSYPEYDRPGRAAASDPAKDEEFLQQLRERAEEQRRRYEEQRKREREGDGQG